MKRVLSAVVLFVGCVDPAFPRPDGGRDFTRCDAGTNDPWCDSASSERFLFSQTTQVCRFIQQCCDEGLRLEVLRLIVGESALPGLLSTEPTLLTDSDACRRGLTRSTTFERRDALRGLDKKRRIYDRDAAALCLSWLERGAAECAPGLVLRTGKHVPPSCENAYRPAVSLGEACLVDGDCLELEDGGVTTCVSNQRETDAGFIGSVTGTCRRVPSRGEPCSLPNGTCESGLYCDKDATCSPRRDLGASCVGAPCREGSFCDGISSQCQPQRGELEPCSSQDMCGGESKCSDTYRVCITVPDPDPLDVSFDYCGGDKAVSKARDLEGVPPDGGLP
jgi:hypothetical protein